MEPESTDLGALSTSTRASSDVKASSSLVPPRIATPPLPSDRIRHEPKQIDESNGLGRIRKSLKGSDSTRSATRVADAMDSTLLKELQRKNRESTPSASPHRKRQRINGDRSVRQLTHLFLSHLRLICTGKLMGEQLHPVPLRPGSASKLQFAPRRWISGDAFEAEEANTSWRASLPEK